MNLPEEVIAICWKYEVYGRIYIPTPGKGTKAEQITRQILEEMEGVYEEMGATFVREGGGRRVFSKFTIEQVRKRYGIAYETARQATNRSRQRWAFWFGKHEAGVLECLSSQERFLYLRIRGLLRSGKQYGYITHVYKGMDIARPMETAVQSIASCPWRGAGADR